MLRTLIAVALVSLPALGGKVWIVDAASGPGFDFTDIDPAVAAAADGDTILVRQGAYTDLVIQGKGLTVVAEVGAAPTFLGGSIRSLGVLQRVRLSGLALTSATEAGLQIKTNAGPVWIEDCFVRGADGVGLLSSPVWHAEGYPAIDVAGSDSVSIARCSLVAGDGDNYATLASLWGDGGAGVLVAGGSKVAVLDCNIVAGNGGDLNDGNTAATGGWGGSGIHVLDGEVVVVGNAIQSGDGGVGGEDYDLFGYDCGSGGDAGSGVSGSFPGTAVIVHAASNSFTSGVPGLAYPGSSCSPGAPGTLFDLYGSSLDALSLAPFSLLAAGPVREGNPLVLGGTGTPGASVILAVAGAPTWVFLPALEGLELIDPVGVLLFPLGTVDGLGAYSASLPTPLVVPAGESLELFMQVIGVDGLTGTLSFGAPAGLSLLDASL